MICSDCGELEIVGPKLAKPKDAIVPLVVNNSALVPIEKCDGFVSSLLLPMPKSKPARS